MPNRHQQFQAGLRERIMLGISLLLLVGFAALTSTTRTAFADPLAEVLASTDTEVGDTTGSADAEICILGDCSTERVNGNGVLVGSTTVDGGEHLGTTQADACILAECGDWDAAAAGEVSGSDILGDNDANADFCIIGSCSGDDASSNDVSAVIDNTIDDDGSSTDAGLCILASCGEGSDTAAIEDNPTGDTGDGGTGGDSSNTPGDGTDGGDTSIADLPGDGTGSGDSGGFQNLPSAGFAPETSSPMGMRLAIAAALIASWFGIAYLIRRNA